MKVSLKEIPQESELMALKNIFNLFLIKRREVASKLYVVGKPLNDTDKDLIVDLQFKELIFNGRIEVFSENNRNFLDLSSMMQEAIDDLDFLIEKA